MGAHATKHFLSLLLSLLAKRQIRKKELKVQAGDYQQKP
jgi:hypothetical protein